MAQEEELDVEKVDERKTPDYWRRWIKAVKKASENHFEDAREAWDEYDEYEERPYPIYWSSIKTIEPAYYSRTPKITTEREFGSDDAVSLTGSICIERLGRHLVRESAFDSVMQKTVLDFLHADKATIQVTFSSDFEEQQVRVDLTQTPDGAFVDVKTQLPYEDEVFQDEVGFFGNKIEKIPVNEKVRAMECSYDEILHTPEAKNESEIKEKAFYFIMDRTETEKRFGKEVADKINWKTKKDAMARDGREANRDLTEIIGEYIEGWECWCLQTKKVYWVSDQYQDGFLDSKEDPYGLRKFFPCPDFIISNRPSKTLYPKPAFQHVKACIDQLHDAAERVSKLTQGCKRRALVDGADDDLIAALNSTEEGEYIAMTNLNKIIERGGLENSVMFVPIVELVKAMTELSNLQEKYKNEFFEWFGVPDILRGATDPLETASAQEIKSTAAHDRFKFAKKQVAQMARDTIEMMVDLALSTFSEETIKQIVGFDFMPPEQQQNFPAALQMLKDPKVRAIRIAIDTDTMSFVDEQQRAIKAQQASQLVFDGLDQITKMIDISPEYAAVGLQALLLSLNAISPGKEFEDNVKKAVEALVKKAQEPKPPAPDYEQMKIQLEQQRLQLETQVKSRDLDRKEMQMEIKAQENQAKLQISAMQSEMKLQVEQSDQTIQRFMAELEAQRVAIEEFKAQMQARESQMEEIRLAREAETNEMTAVIESIKTKEVGEAKELPPPQIINVSAPAMPPINLTIDAKSGTSPISKKISVTRDELGNATGYEVTEEASVPFLGG